MKWIECPNSDEHVLCDPRGCATEYRVRRDPVTFVYAAYDGDRRVNQSMAIYPCQKTCEQLYQLERLGDSKFKPKNPRGRYSKRESA